MADFTRIVQDVKKRFDVKVRRWRGNMTGKAWRVYHDDGRVVNWIESPQPKTPISLAIFLHEVGHHVVGFETYKRRCEEEYHVWLWALNEMRRQNVEPDEKVQKRFDLSVRYAVAKAQRRGIKNLPEALVKFAPQPS